MLPLNIIGLLCWFLLTLLMIPLLVAQSSASSQIISVLGIFAPLFHGKWFQLSEPYQYFSKNQFSSFAIFAPFK